MSASVRVSFPPGSADCAIMFGAVRLDCSHPVDFTLLSSETATFASTTTDLSGTLVEASTPVAVYARNRNALIGSGNVTDSTAEQLFPVAAWGRQFVAAPVPDNQQSGYSIRLSCGSGGNASVVISGAVHHLSRQRPLTVHFASNQPAYISVIDGPPVQLVQFVRGAMVDTDSGAPAALVIPAVERFSHVYNITAVPGFINYVSVVARRLEVGGLRLNSQTLSTASSWVNISSDWATTAIRLTPATSYVLEHTGQRPFGAYSYGYISGRCAFANPAGASLPLQVSSLYFSLLAIKTHRVAPKMAHFCVRYNVVKL